FWLWCFALLPRTWHGRYGIRRATIYFFAKILRDPFSWLVCAVWLIGSLAITLIWWSSGIRWTGLFTSLTGMAVGMGLIWTVRLVGRAVLRKEAMGFGDVTLMAMIGAFTGWQASLVIFFLAPLAGLVIGLIQFLLHRDNIIPYGPFLCLATLVTLVYWSPIWAYLRPAFAMGWLIPITMVACMAVMAVLLFVLQLIKGLMFR
ncbi:MAG: prepilin peptidase, partial [Planctomycetales bacterium]|nr:prepilin peptidase [Planctomycetales bacterium]NIM09220.1 prepilin peptidase [Planctomycetales bacterium]NIN08691.1 prepilin peptidase [Planctomycetales bacterium]NIN77806.1 prepilin peptidase [Planctomycetales bacterium]NIO34983.1 prepilin peptidase [Planctomycetales bacterium]